MRFEQLLPTGVLPDGERDLSCGTAKYTYCADLWTWDCSRVAHKPAAALGDTKGLYVQACNLPRTVSRAVTTQSLLLSAQSWPSAARNACQDSKPVRVSATSVTRAAAMFAAHM